MTAKTTALLYIAGAKDDPCAGLLGAYLRHAFPDTQLRDLDERELASGTDSIWFLSQHAFLAETANLMSLPGTINVVIRRPVTPQSDDSFSNELGVLAEILRRFSSDQVKLWSLTEEARTDISNGSMPLDTSVLNPDGIPRTADRVVRYDPDRQLFILDTPNGQQTIPAKMVNWARIARPCHIDATGLADGDHRDLVDFANRLPETAVRPDQEHYLFITPNGVGMGHLTRQLAIADALMAAAPEGAAASVDG